ncbi:DUF6207 family protein [Streptomyces sp. SP18CS02]|uniref:DUF6207 family protein n=1 Tax=Streptomyces sp. SP18CS02 TaxID=3002531 RepID=UPI002E7631A0|nr:DUF6207 family protein [Streptomyces sp. SP18CS02]MEE1753005.1 DUF6207 family protein [Streptomyces sp. SP18CS02]
MQIDEQYIAEPGLVVLDISAADEDTVRAVMERLQQQWRTSGVTPVWRTRGESGVRARWKPSARPKSPSVRRANRRSNEAVGKPVAHACRLGPGCGYA